LAALDLAFIHWTSGSVLAVFFCKCDLHIYLNDLHIYLNLMVTKQWKTVILQT